MAQFPGFGVESPVEAAQYGRGMGVKTAGDVVGKIGGVVSGVGKYLKDKALKQRLVDEIVSRYKDAEPYRQQLLDLDPTTLGEKVYMMKNLEEKASALKQQYPDITTPSPFMSAMNMPTVDRLKDWDSVFENMGKMGKEQYETSTTGSQLEKIALRPGATYGQAISALGGESPTKTTQTAIGELPKYTAEEMAAQRATPRPPTERGIEEYGNDLKNKAEVAAASKGGTSSEELLSEKKIIDMAIAVVRDKYKTDSPDAQIMVSKVMKEIERKQGAEIKRAVLANTELRPEIDRVLAPSDAEVPLVEKFDTVNRILKAKGKGMTAEDYFKTINQPNPFEGLVKVTKTQKTPGLFGTSLLSKETSSDTLVPGLGPKPTKADSTITGSKAVYKF